MIARIKNLIFKLQVLAALLEESFRYWKDSIYAKDPDEPYCCDGGSVPTNICGCHGATVREMYQVDKQGEG